MANLRINSRRSFPTNRHHILLKIDSHLIQRGKDRQHTASPTYLVSPFLFYLPPSSSKHCQVLSPTNRKSIIPWLAQTDDDDVLSIHPYNTHRTCIAQTKHSPKKGNQEEARTTQVWWRRVESFFRRRTYVECAMFEMYTHTERNHRRRRRGVGSFA